MWEYNEKVKGEDTAIPMVDHDVLLKRRKQELKHAQDVKQLYEERLQHVNRLFVELNAWKLQLDAEARTLERKKRQMVAHPHSGSKVSYHKKKLRPISIGKAAKNRLQQHKAASPSTPEVLSTSPESPFHLPMEQQQSYGSPSRFGAAAVAPAAIPTPPNPHPGGGDDLPRPKVRLNPLYFHSSDRRTNNVDAELPSNFRHNNSTAVNKFSEQQNYFFRKQISSSSNNTNASSHWQKQAIESVSSLGS